MNKNTLLIKKITLAAMLGAISIIIDVFFKYLLGIQNFGVPFYAIPLIIISIVLGPFYGLVIGFITDGIGVYLSGQGYLISFAFAALVWGTIPGLFLHKRYKTYRLTYVVFITHLLATLANTLAMYIEFDKMTTLATLAIRLTFIPLNSVIIFYVVNKIYLRLTPFHQPFSYKLGNDKKAS